MDEPVRWVRREQWEAVRSKQAWERWTSLQFEQWGAQVGEEGVWVPLNTPLAELWEQGLELGWHQLPGGVWGSELQGARGR